MLIVAVFLAWTVSMASALTLMFGGPSGCGIALPAGPFVTLVAGGVKARSPLAKLPGETSWPAMLTVSSVMFLARAVGMVRPLRGWRTGS